MEIQRLKELAEAATERLTRYAVGEPVSNIYGTFDIIDCAEGHCNDVLALIAEREALAGEVETLRACLKCGDESVRTAWTREAEWKAEVERLKEALEAYKAIHKSVAADLHTAHENRGNGASQWMREDDTELRRDFMTAGNLAREALAGLQSLREGSRSSSASLVSTDMTTQEPHRQDQHSAGYGCSAVSNPEDCAWPFCGCDPAADKVLAAIQEHDMEIVPVHRDGATPPALERALAEYYRAMHEEVIPQIDAALRAQALIATRLRLGLPAESGTDSPSAPSAPNASTEGL